MITLEFPSVLKHQGRGTCPTIGVPQGSPRPTFTLWCEGVQHGPFSVVNGCLRGPLYPATGKLPAGLKFKGLLNKGRAEKPLKCVKRTITVIFYFVDSFKLADLVPAFPPSTPTPKDRL